VSTDSLIFFINSTDFCPVPTILDAIPLCDVECIRSIIGDGDDDASLCRRRNSFQRVRSAVSKGSEVIDNDPGDKDTIGWAESLPRVSGGNRFSNTVEIRQEMSSPYLVWYQSVLFVFNPSCLFSLIRLLVFFSRAPLVS
jgi:hypothetical protein